MNDSSDQLNTAAELIRHSSRTVAFTGAGVSVESGIPPFRGGNGLWSQYDPGFLDIHYFRHYPEESWQLIKEIFYDFFGKARPNKAHDALAKLEQSGYLQSIITQNIDNLHQEAGSKAVYEFHGNSRGLICQQCSEYYAATNGDLTTLPPRCAKCDGVLKPDFVFFGEPTPEPTKTNSFNECLQADVFVLIGTTGEIMPASLIPYEADRNHTTIIEINIAPSHYTRTITDIFLEGKASIVMQELVNAVIS